MSGVLESAFRLFDHVALVLVLVEGTVLRRILHGLNEHARKVLRLLDISVDVFTRP